MRKPTNDRRTVAAFDFDGTLIEGASMTVYLKHLYSRPFLLYTLGRLLPGFFAFSTGIRPRTVFKEQFLTRFLGGKTAEFLFQEGRTIAANYLPDLIRPAGLKRLRWHQAEGHRCILVTASLSFWTEAFAEMYGMELVATEPELVEGIFTGKIIGENNYGPAKVTHLNAYLGEEAPAYLYAYGDTNGDRELLAFADEGFFRPFHKGGELETGR